jgi:hypothetical protein
VIVLLVVLSKDKLLEMRMAQTGLVDGGGAAHMRAPLRRAARGDEHCVVGFDDGVCASRAFWTPCLRDCSGSLAGGTHDGAACRGEC